MKRDTAWWVLAMVVALITLICIKAVIAEAQRPPIVVPQRTVIIEGSRVDSDYIWGAHSLVHKWFVDRDLGAVPAIQRHTYIDDTVNPEAYTMAGYFNRLAWDWYAGAATVFAGVERPIEKYKRGITVFWAPAIDHCGKRYGAGWSMGGLKGGQILLHTKAEERHKMYFAALHETLNLFGANDDCHETPEDTANVMCAAHVQKPWWIPLEISEANYTRVRKTIERHRRQLRRERFIERRAKR